MSVADPSEVDTATPLDPESTVTPKQLELLALYASGYSYARIAGIKFLSPHTVKNTLTLALRRSGARNLTHLCMAAREAGMIRLRGDTYEPVQDLRIV